MQSTPEQQPEYYDLETMLEMIDGPNGAACRQMYVDHKDKFLQASGSSHNHQAWPGGYIDHVTDAMNIGLATYDLFNGLRTLDDSSRSDGFSRSDVLLIVFLHDLEKPFKYTYNEDGTISEDPSFPDKAAGEAFKRKMISDYGIELSELQDNALEFVEGIRDSKYQRGKRVMGGLAVVCHIADLTSARLWYNHTLAEGDEWQGAKRQNSAAAGITLPSEF